MASPNRLPGPAAFLPAHRVAAGELSCNMTAANPASPSGDEISDSRAINPFESALGDVVAQIRAGRYATGDRLPAERELCELLGISRVTMRSVIRALQQAGYISTRRGRSGGSFVVWGGDDPPAASAILGTEMKDRLLDQLEFRSVLEPGAAWLAATTTLTPEQIADLQHRLQAARDAHSTQFRVADSELHLCISRLAGCTALTDATANIQLMLNQTLLQVVPIMKPAREHSNEQHEQIVQAIIECRANRARELMHQHVCATTELIRSFLA